MAKHSDEAAVCDVCGKTELVQTMEPGDLEGEYYCQECVARAERFLDASREYEKNYNVAWAPCDWEAQGD